jgi:hypothetical protein
VILQLAKLGQAVVKRQNGSKGAIARHSSLPDLFNDGFYQNLIFSVCTLKTPSRRGFLMD